jgi:hypothetical protein
MKNTLAHWRERVGSFPASAAASALYDRSMAMDIA